MKFLFISLACVLCASAVYGKNNATEKIKSAKLEKLIKSTQELVTPKPDATLPELNPFDNYNYRAELSGIDPNLFPVGSNNPRFPLDPRYDTISYSQFEPFEGNQRKPAKVKITNPEIANQNNFVLENGQRFQIQQSPFQQQIQQPQNLNTAIGAISAHILSQNKNQEYIPFPPNGDPNGYPGYYRNNFGNEPPLIAAYERANTAGYGSYPTTTSEKANYFHPAFGQHPADVSNQFGQQYGFNYYNPRSFGDINGFYPVEQIPQIPIRRTDFGREEVTEGTNALRQHGREPIKRHSL